MSHPVPGHDYTEKAKDETEKEYRKRAKIGMSVKSKVADKMPHGYKNKGPMTPTKLAMIKGAERIIALKKKNK